MSAVWLVWSECGKYEDFSRELRGVFISAELAQAHSERLRAHEPNLDKIYVECREAMSSLPEPASRLEIRAHISSDGEELRYRPFTPGEPLAEISGPERISYKTWIHEDPSVSGSIKPWGTSDLYVMAAGTDSDAVETEYSRLVAEAREQLASTRRADGLAL